MAQLYVGSDLHFSVFSKCSFQPNPTIQEWAEQLAQSCKFYHRFTGFTVVTTCFIVGFTGVTKGFTTGQSRGPGMLGGRTSQRMDHQPRRDLSINGSNPLGIIEMYFKSSYILLRQLIFICSLFRCLETAEPPWALGSPSTAVHCGGYVAVQMIGN